VVTLDPKLEDLISAHIERSERGSYLSLPPDTQGRIVAAVRGRVEQGNTQAAGHTVAVLCSPQVRMWVRRLIEQSMPHVPVLAYNEIVRGIEIQSLGLVVVTDGTENLPG
jgi:flagellar biosynthesis protein FlhA